MPRPLKPTEDGLQKTLDRIAALRQRLARVDRLRGLGAREEWKDLRDLLMELKGMHARAVEQTVEGLSYLEPVELVSIVRRHQGCRDAFSAVLELIERPQEEAERLRVSIEDLEREVSQKKTELSAY